MAATPQYGTMIFVGQSGRTYVKDLYLSDVAGAAVRFDSGAGAGAASSDFMTFPENVTLVDYAQVTGTADTTKLRLTVNNVPTGQVLRYTIHLTSLNNRPKLLIPIGKDARFSGIQLA